MIDQIGPEQAKINAHFAAVRDDLKALEEGKAHREFEEAVDRVDEYLREGLADDTNVDTRSLARRAVIAVRGLT